MIPQTRRNFLVTSLATTSVLAAPALLRAQPASPPRVRRNASTMVVTDPFFADYSDAVTALHELDLGGLDGWRKQALLHLEFCPHGAADFLAWHRHYITIFEIICGELLGKPEFALAYWDWSSADGELPRPFFDNGGLNVEFWRDEANASHPNWAGGRPVRTSPTRGITAGFGLQDDPARGGSFTARNISRIKRLDRFNLFQRRLEGSPHNNGHVVVGSGGGHVGNGMSPLDPAFWLHHCNIDRIWAEWQFDGNGTPNLDRKYEGQLVDASGMVIDGDFTADNARNTNRPGLHI